MLADGVDAGDVYDVLDGSGGVDRALERLDDLASHIVWWESASEPVALLEQGRVVPLKRLLTNWDFRSYKSYPAYTAAGSFIKYLLAEYGPQKLSKLFELDKYSQRDMIEESFAAAYGREIDQVEENWRAALQSGTLVTAPRRPDPQSSNTALAVTGIILLAATFVGAMLLITAGERVADAAIRRLRILAGMVSRRLGLHPRE